LYARSSRILIAGHFSSPTRGDGRDADAGLRDCIKGEGGTVDQTKEEALKAALAGVQAAVPAAAA
jgi:hypothetical protein